MMMMMPPFAFENWFLCHAYLYGHACTQVGISSSQSTHLDTRNMSTWCLKEMLCLRWLSRNILDQRALVPAGWLTGWQFLSLPIHNVALIITICGQQKFVYLHIWHLVINGHFYQQTDNDSELTRQDTDRPEPCSHIF